MRVVGYLDGVNDGSTMGMCLLTYVYLRYVYVYVEKWKWKWERGERYPCRRYLRKGLRGSSGGTEGGSGMITIGIGFGERLNGTRILNTRGD